jgi:hypothetical protein
VDKTELKGKEGKVSRVHKIKTVIVRHSRSGGEDVENGTVVAEGAASPVGSNGANSEGVGSTSGRSVGSLVLKSA